MQIYLFFMGYWFFEKNIHNFFICLFYEIDSKKKGALLCAPLGFN